MERDWQLVKQGVGDNLIFEGTEGLAQNWQIPKRKEITNNSQ